MTVARALEDYAVDSCERSLVCRWRVRSLWSMLCTICNTVSDLRLVALGVRSVIVLEATPSTLKTLETTTIITRVN